MFRDTHPDFEMTTQRGPNAGTHRRREGVQSFGEDYISAFDEMTIELGQLLSLKSFPDPEKALEAAGLSE